MSDVTVPFGDSAEDTATLLLAEAEKQDLDPSVVKVDSSGPTGLAFRVPEEVAKGAGVDTTEETSNEDQVKADEERLQAEEDAKSAVASDTTEDQVVDQEAEQNSAAKKTTAKKTAAKKTAK